MRHLQTSYTNHPSADWSPLKNPLVALVKVRTTQVEPTLNAHQLAMIALLASGAIRAGLYDRRRTWSLLLAGVRSARATSPEFVLLSDVWQSYSKCQNEVAL